MAKMIVKIDFKDMPAEELRAQLVKHHADWFPLGDNQTISIDHACLALDPDEDDFYLFEFVKIEEES